MEDMYDVRERYEANIRGRKATPQQSFNCSRPLHSVRPVFSRNGLEASIDEQDSLSLSLFTCKRALTNNDIRLATPMAMTSSISSSSAGDGVMPKRHRFPTPACSYAWSGDNLRCASVHVRPRGGA